MVIGYAQGIDEDLYPYYYRAREVFHGDVVFFTQAAPQVTR